jgi:signal transduction histidine kinase/ActR/RegA family two-component response regulator
MSTRAFSSAVVERLTPFFVCWSPSGKVTYVSEALAMLWDLTDDADWAEVKFHITRPKMGILQPIWLSELTDILMHLECMRMPGRTIRGQILPDAERWIFVGSPCVFSIEEVHRVGMQLSDFPLHESTGDLLLAAETAQAALQETQDKARELEVINEELTGANAILSGLIPPDLRDTLGIEPVANEMLSQKMLLVRLVIERLQAALDFRERFLATMSHELRTPLNAILGISEALTEGIYGELTDRQRVNLETVLSSGDHLLALINDVLNMSKIEAGEAVLSIGETDANRLCLPTLRMLQSSAKSKGLPLEFEDRTEGALFECDTRRIRQVILNLVGNALKFTEHGKVVLSVEQELGTGGLIFSVTDSGIGISPEDQVLLFDPFFQVQNERNRKYQGTGLGLAITKHTVELHGGTLAVESQIGQGSRFTFELPQHPSTTQVTNAAFRSHEGYDKPEIAVATQTMLSTVRVLIAEDDAISRELLTDHLTPKVGHVEATVDGLAALNHILTQQSDVLITDVKMPGMTGLELVRCIRALPRLNELAIVVASSSINETAEADFLAAGADYFLRKPYKMSKLPRIVLDILERRKAGGWESSS